ncbi:MAG: prepilin-type N-terminal cleavage/methylation domain-containing protein, partial [Synergistaceae bacterium]|nr:prepilin-type N-terminal cleavage/methylation domain-containing protein [Synergistaceae bacterium]
MNIKKAFTLVELLIVVCVIGILVAITVLSGSQATTTAKANNILNDMRHIRDAARM